MVRLLLKGLCWICYGFSVFSTFMHSRTRKIRCDGAKPICHNCSRRSTGSGGTCSYDSAPKRRGPDKTPGARQRAGRDASQETDADVVTVHRRRRKRDTSLPSKSDIRSTGEGDADPGERLSPAEVASPVSPIPVTPISSLDESSEHWSSFVPSRGFTTMSRVRPTINNTEQVFTLR